MPHWLSGRSQRFGTPHRAIAVSVLAPVAVVGRRARRWGCSGDMYSFGLLGAFTLTASGSTGCKWQESKRGIGFWLRHR